jgi:hypothetical protein
MAELLPSEFDEIYNKNQKHVFDFRKISNELKDFAKFKKWLDTSLKGDYAIDLIEDVILLSDELDKKTLFFVVDNFK